ncbi:MAG: hypothetical protein ABI990_05205 [Actinomycetota bacterium]
MAVGHEIDKAGKRPRKRAVRAPNSAGAVGNGVDPEIPESELVELLTALQPSRSSSRRTARQTPTTRC